MKSPIDYFMQAKDPRVERRKEHLLEDIIFITIAAVICGAETWNDIEAYGKQKKEWLRCYLKLPNGIPSHDTFNRVFAAIDPLEFETSFLRWIKAVAELTHGEVVSIDGKTIRGSKKTGAKSAIHMVSAWANANQLALGQVKVDDKSNEITAIPKLLEVLALKGCIVTIDAMGCQTAIVDKIVNKQADYVIAVKGNQGLLEEGIKDTVRFCKPFSVWGDTDVGHGRVETRKCFIYTDFSHIENLHQWNNLHGVVKIESTRYIKATGIQQTENRFYITSMEPHAEKIARSIRSHWGIENNLHWILDVAFHEDQSRKREGYAAQNFAMINRIALNLINNKQDNKRSVKGKRLDAGWNNDYLLKILKN
jgi:predicted transposase YbfD/YdcC